MRPLGIVTVVCALAGLAHATPSPEALQTLRIQAEQQEKDGQFAACGATYLDLIKASPPSESPELMYDAGICLERAGQLGAAIEVREQLIKRVPASLLAMRALAMNAQAYAQLGDFARAAERDETVAQKFAGDRNSVQALSDASYFRRSLGQTARYRADVELFIKLYGAKQREQAAAAQFGVLAYLHEHAARGDAAARKLLGPALAAWLKTWGPIGGADRMVIAEAWTGELLLAKACHGEAGACIAPVRRPVKAPCGGVATPLLATPRPAAVLTEARGHLERAAALWQRGAVMQRVATNDEAERQQRTAAAGYWASAARFWLADQSLERMGFSKPPSGANGKRWMQDLSHAMVAASRSYQDTFSEAAADWGIASLFRMGQLYQQTMTLARLTPIPAGLAPGDRGAFCSGFSSAAEPFTAKVREAFEACLAKAQQLGSYTHWSASCQAELETLDPRAYPRAAEIVPAVRAASSLATTPVLSAR